MTVDGFRLVRQLNGGRHGAVWQAVQTATESRVALRELTGADQAACAAIMIEIARLRRVSNRHVVGCHDPVSESGTCWLVEDWVDGINLATLQAGSTELTRAQALGIVRGTLIGLAAVHQLGISHGELSPHSIMIDSDGEPVIVGFAAHLADESVADADGYASPELRAGGHPAPTADVFVVGTLLDRMLDSAERPAEISRVITRATGAEPADRHRDAGELLADLEHAAERSYGAGWWTTAGLSGLVASGTAVTAAGAAAGGAVGGAGSGAVSGAVSAGSGVLAGAEHAAGSGAVAAVRTGVSSGARTGLLLAGAAALVVVIVVGASAALRAGSNNRTGDETVLAAPSQAAASPARQAPTSQAPADRTAASPTPKPTPKPKPNKTLSFTGKYRYEWVITKSNRPYRPVGQRAHTTWTVKTACKGSTCSSQITQGTEDEPFDLNTGGKQWNQDFTYKVQCVNTKTGKPAGGKVKMHYSRTLRPRYAKNGTLISVKGTDRTQQLDECEKQVLPMVEYRSKITVTKIK